MVKSAQVVLRVDAELVELADEVNRLAREVAGGVEASRSAVMRAALLRGLEQRRVQLERLLRVANARRRSESNSNSGG